MMIYVIIGFAVIICAVIGYSVDRKKFEQYKKELLGSEEMNNVMPSGVSQVENVPTSEVPQQDIQQTVQQFVNPQPGDATNNVQSNQDVPVVPQ